MPANGRTALAVLDRALAFLATARNLLLDIREVFVRRITKLRIDALIEGHFVEVGAMAYQMPDDKPTTFKVTAVDIDGNPTTLPPGTVITWGSSDLTRGVVAPAPDGSTVVLSSPTGILGPGLQLNVSAMFPGAAAPLTGQLDVEIIAGTAVSLQISPA